MTSISPTLFDPSFYVSQFDQIIPIEQAYEHYQSVGAKLGATPSPYFDVFWYRQIANDLEEYQGDIPRHYKEVGAKQRLDPHPLFKSAWYAHNYLGDDSLRNEDPLEHFANKGWREGKNPNPIFWTSWYESTHLSGLATRLNPFVHYVTEGSRKFDPNPIFSTLYYIANSSTPLSLNPDPLSHYMHIGWRNHAKVHPLFDANHYLAMAGISFESLTVSPLEHFLVLGHRSDPHPLFRNEYYKTQLRANGVEVTNEHPLVIYLSQGRRSSVSPHPFFNKKYYDKHQPQAVSDNVDSLCHYAAEGWKKRDVKFHPLFDTATYRTNIGTDEVPPLEHYIAAGAAQGISIRQHAHPDSKLRQLPTSRAVQPVSLTHARQGKVETDKRIGAFIHAYYPDLMPEIIAYTNNVPDTCTLYISTDTYAKRQQILDHCTKLSTHRYEVRVLPNRGRDIAPWLVGFADRMREVEYGFHLHTKKSRHYAKQFDAWREYLYKGNLGTTQYVANIIQLLENKNIGIVAPDHYYPILSLIQWGGNFDNASRLVELMGDELHRDEVLDFPSGSMFWFKTSALEPLLELNLPQIAFDPEAGQVDGTLAHAVERLFYTVAAIAGYEYVISKPVSGPVEENKASSNLYHPTRKIRGVSGDHFPETTGFLVRPSTVNKPRINLLIPTVDRAVGYAGVSSALDVYHAVREELGRDFDGRLLATDVSMDNQFNPPDGYEVLPATARDRADIDLVQDVATRWQHPMFARKNDYFLATAWWTAQNAFDIADQQARLFGGQPNKTAYLIQDNENGFYPWSTKFVLADATYRHPDRTIPVFNTEILYEDFKRRGYYSDGVVYQPAINQKFMSQITSGTKKEKMVLLYARPHAERNCLPFLSMVVQTLYRDDPAYWSEWRFFAIGEDFNSEILKTDHIEVLGRLSLDEYAQLSSRAALAVSLMVSPHPSYPPLEMAQAGVRVLTNTFEGRDLSKVHENISSFDSFAVGGVAQQLRGIADDWEMAQQSGWSGKPLIDWFFGGNTNITEVARSVAQKIRDDLTRSH